MRKFFSILLVVSVFLLTMTGCVENEKKDYENLSKLENYYFVGENSMYRVILKGGKREVPLLLDGVAGKLEDYVEIFLKVKSGSKNDFSFYIGINDADFKGDFKEEFFGGNYKSEVKAKNIEDEKLVIRISNGVKEDEIVLESQVGGKMISWQEAKAIAEKELKSEILQMKDEKFDNYEIYIKFLLEENEGKAFYYVSFINEEKLLAVLINPTSKKIEAKRT